MLALGTRICYYIFHAAKAAVAETEITKYFKKVKNVLDKAGTE